MAPCATLKAKCRKLSVGQHTVLTDGGRLFAALIPRLPGFLSTAQHCNVYNFCSLAIFKNAIPRLQNSNTLHCCAVTFPRHCLILSNSQYHVLFIRFALYSADQQNTSSGCKEINRTHAPCMPPYFLPPCSYARQAQSHTDTSLPMPPTSLSCPLLSLSGPYPWRRPNRLVLILSIFYTIPVCFTKTLKYGKI